MVSPGSRLAELRSSTDLDQALRVATAVLAEAGVPTPRADAELLVAYLLNTSRGGVVAAALRGTPPPAGLADLVDGRAARIPLQYLTGAAHFRDVQLAVGPGVFVPRPETELVAGLAVEAARELVSAHGTALVADLGTGSGAIALAVATEVPDAQVLAVEVDRTAAAWAERNFRGQQNIQLVVADVQSALLNCAVDVVVTNPPYVPPDTPTEPEVVHDPPLALWGRGTDGLDVARAFVAAAVRALRPGGFFVMEHAESQVDSVRTLLAPHFDEVVNHNDLTGRPRMTSGLRNSTAAR